MTQPVRLVIFDMDGTLIDSQAFIIRAMNLAFDQMSLAAPTEDAVRSIIGLSLFEAITTLVPDLSSAETDRGVELYKQAFVTLREQEGDEGAVHMYPKAKDTLAELSQIDEVLLGVATGKAKRGVDHAFQAHGIGSYFVTTQTADGHPSKPHPSMILATMSETGATPENTVIVGDTTYDMAMGQAAGVRTVGVTWGYHSVQELQTQGCDCLITHFDELRPALEGFWGTL